MKERIEALMAEIEGLSCKTEQEIEEARVRLLGKKGEITRLFEEFRTVAPELKREFGQKLNVLKNAAAAKIEALKEAAAESPAEAAAAAPERRRYRSGYAGRKGTASDSFRRWCKSGPDHQTECLRLCGR